MYKWTFIFVCPVTNNGPEKQHISVHLAENPFTNDIHGEIFMSFMNINVVCRNHLVIQP